MAQHTPGPWGFDRESGEVFMQDGEGIHACIATVDFDNTDPPQAIADGELLAAAPDLLDVARMLVERRDAPAPRFGLSDCVMRARAAIAKAEGRR